MNFTIRHPMFAEESTPSGGGGGDPFSDNSSRVGDISLGGPGPSLEVSQTGVVDDKPAEMAKPAEAKPTEVAKTAETAAPTWTFEKFMSQIGAGFKEDDKRFNDFKAVKDFTGQTIKANETLALKELELSAKVGSLEKQLAEAMAKPGGAVSADVATIQTQLNDITGKYTEAKGKLDDFDARGKIEGHPIFKKEFDANQASIFRSMQQTAEAVKLTTEQVEGVLAQRGELAITKAVNALGDIDPDAKGILKARALEWDGLQAKRDDLLAGKTGKRPSELLAEYEAMQAEFGVQLSQNFSRDLTGKLVAGVDAAHEKLAKEHPLFATAHGKTLAESLRIELQTGKIPSAQEVVENTMLARVAPAWQNLAKQYLGERDVLQAQVTRLTGQLPKGDAASGAVTTPRTGAPSLNTFVDPSARTSDIVLRQGTH